MYKDINTIIPFRKYVNHVPVIFFPDIMLDDVRCYGDETSIIDCDHNYWGQHNCAKNEAAGVFCAPLNLKEKQTEKTKPTTKQPTTTTTTTPKPSTVPPKTEPPLSTTTFRPTLRNDVIEETLDVNHINPLNSVDDVEDNNLVILLPEESHNSNPEEIRRLDDIEEEEQIAEFNLAPVVAADLEDNNVNPGTESHVSVASEESHEDVTSTTVNVANATDPVLAEIFLKKQDLKKQIEESKARENEFIHESKEPSVQSDPHHPSVSIIL